MSNSPAYKAHPELFKNIVRDNPTKFFKKFLKIEPTRRIFTEEKSDKDFTDPL